MGSNLTGMNLFLNSFPKEQFIDPLEQGGKHENAAEFFLFFFLLFFFLKVYL